jgi:hypothetical protein
MRIRMRFRTSPPPAVRLDPVAADLVRFSSLLQIVMRAVAWQDQADAVILECAQPGETPREVACRGREVAGEYGRLSGWAADLGAHDALTRRAGELIRYHVEMLDVTLKLAFPLYRSEKLERRRLALTGLGRPAQDLRNVEAALRARVAELEGQ